jgi:hypothetical protein
MVRRTVVSIIVLSVCVGLLSSTTPVAYSQSYWKSTLTIQSMMSGAGTSVNTLRDESGGCEPSRWVYQVGYSIKGGAGCSGLVSVDEDASIPCQPASWVYCPEYLTYESDWVAAGCTVAWFTHRDDGDSPNHNIAECGTSNPIADQAYGNDMRWTPASQATPDVSVSYDYGSS